MQPMSSGAYNSERMLGAQIVESQSVHTGRGGRDHLVQSSRSEGGRETQSGFFTPDHRTW